MLIEIHCQKRIVSNVVLAILDHRNLKFSSTANHCGRYRTPLLFKISGSAPVIYTSIELTCSTLITKIKNNLRMLSSLEGFLFMHQMSHYVVT